MRWGADTIRVIREVKGSQSSADLGFCCGDGIQTFQFLIRLNVGQRWSRGPQEGAGLEWEPNETPENSGGRLPWFSPSTPFGVITVSFQGPSPSQISM